MAIEIKSFNQILGGMVRKVIAETPLNDINAGSVLLTLLEACASNDFENNTAILNVLELLNIDVIKNNDLDAKAADYGLIRRTAIKASGLVSIRNSNITKRSTGLYVIKPAPISGQTVLYVNNTDGWASSGSIYIGRETDSFEGPIPYTSITQYSTYSEITLGNALQKDHLISDVVTDSQGEPDRIINAGTVVKIPANNQNPEIQYVTLRDAVIPAGEDGIGGVEVIALIAGSNGNAQLNTITQFDAAPFSGATVTNTSSFSNGKDVETDTELRNRIKSYSITLARGTAPSIVSAIQGLSDPDDNKQVVSAVITEPVKTNDPSILYIDDGSGFQPSYAGQSVDALLSNANGTEEFLQLANYPVTRPQVVNTAEGPFSFSDSMFLRVVVDGEEETITFSSSNFQNISAATLAETIIAINDQSSLFKARFTNNSKNILLYPVAHDAEILQVSALRSSDNVNFYANNVLKFPTNETSYIALYQNSTRLKEKSKTAFIESVPYAQWGITTGGNIVIAVDGTPYQDRSFAISDFSGASSFSSLTLEQWVQAFNNKFAGITALATPAQTMKIFSNKEGSSSRLVISDGSYLNKIFIGKDLDVSGQSAQFQLNRQTGNLRILTEITKGDTITAGAEDTKGFVVSSSTSSGVYNVADDSFGRPAEIVFVVDSSSCDQKSVPLVIGTNIVVTNEGNSLMKIISSALDTFANLEPGDFVYLTKRSSGWLSNQNTGLFKIKSKGKHLVGGVDSYVEVSNNDTVEEAVTVLDSADIKAFRTDGYPQIWRGSYVSNPPAESISGVIASINNSVLGAKAKVFRSNSIKITSNTETSGSISIPISTGNATSLFTSTNSLVSGYPSHVANRASDKALVGLFKRTDPVSSNVWLDRHVYSDLKGSLLSDSTPDSPPFASTYSEILQSSAFTSSNLEYSDILAITSGNNKGLLKYIKAKTAADSLGTQQGLIRTSLDFAQSDQFTVMDSLRFAADDSTVFILDKDAAAKTIDIKMSRIGQINSGSNSSTFIPTTTEFSANDVENEPGIDFSTANVWGMSINNTDFSDYTLLMRSRNWYSSDGVNSTTGKLMLRSAQYGVNGNKFRFSVKYPSTPNQENTTVLQNTPSWSLFSYFFGSGANTLTGLSSADTLAVKGPYPNSSINFPGGTTSSGKYYDYTFSGGNFGSIQIGSILSILDGSGISSFNRGQFRVVNKSGNTLRVLNENASITSVGAPEVTTYSTISDVLGSRTEVTITTVAESAGTGLSGKYLTIYDNTGSVKIWFDVNNSGTSEPVSSPHNRTIKIATILTGDSASVVAAKIADYLVYDTAFTNVFAASDQVIYNLSKNGPVSSPSNGAGSASPNFTFVNTPGASDVSLDGKYFLLHDDVGSVAVWFDVGNNGTQEPFHGAQRSIKVETINYGDTASTVAAAISAKVNSDSKFSAMAVGSNLTISTSFNANTQNATAGTSGFGISITSGATSGQELISNPDQIYGYALFNKTVKEIADKINEKDILKAAAIGLDTLEINKSTKDEDYTYVDNSTALSYGHNPNSSSNDFVELYDGINWIKAFSNANPNFTLKKEMALNNVAPSVYCINTAPNEDGSTGEYFKLVPTTAKNIYHHFTQKALSQLPIISYIDMSDSGKNVQIKSKQLGSQGSIEVVGGRANKAEAYIIGESEISADTNGNKLLLKIPAFPDAFSIGDTVKIQNDTGVKRKSRLKSTDSISVINPSPKVIEYNFNPKNTNFKATTQFTIADVSGIYSRPANTVWRWTHDGLNGATLADVNAGDIVSAFGTLTGWSNENKASVPGDGKVAGFPIVAVNDSENWFDTVNPSGQEMSVPTSIGIYTTFSANTNFGTFLPVAVNTSTNVITLSNTFIANQVINFNSTNSLPLGLQANADYYIVNPTNSTFQLAESPNGSPISLISQGAGLHTVSSRVLTNPSSVALLQLGHRVTGQGIPAGAYITSIYSSYVEISTNVTQSNQGITVSVPNTVQICPTPIIRWNLMHEASGPLKTKYKIEKLNINGLTRISVSDGQSAQFIDCGVAVDDYIVLSGDTFNSNNNGRFRVLAVDNNSVLIMNPQATDELNTLISFSGATWTTNSNIIIGASGTFINVSIGDWIKKQEDSDDYYRQVISMNSAPDTATQITLGSNYAGVSGVAIGVAYDQQNNYNKGVYLNNIDDIAFYEGDSVVVGDTLSIQNIVNSNWFNVLNTGNFEIVEVGTNAIDYKPFLRINNSAGKAENNRLLSTNSDGFAVIESLANKFVTYRKIEHICIDSANSNRRILYVTPANRSYKFSEANYTKIIHSAKLDYNTDIITGIDGYQYYTGLLRRVQRTVDGFEPDSENFPGRRAVGGLIETLPPLPKNITLSVDITTNEGVNLGDISNSIKSTIINYVNSLSVGEDVILSEIIAAVMQIKGVAAVTFTEPVPSTERISIADNEKAIITKDNIGIA